MNSKFLVAALAGAVVLFVAGYLIYGLALAGFFEANVGTATGVIKPTPDFLWIGIGQIAGGILLASVLTWRGAATMTGGAKTGAALGFLISAAMGFTQLGAFNISNLTATVVDPFLQAILMGAAGAVVGVMLSRGAEG